MNIIDHEAAKLSATSSIKAYEDGCVFPIGQITISRAYIDMVKQRDALMKAIKFRDLKISTLQVSNRKREECIVSLKAALGEAKDTLVSVADAIESTHGDDPLYRRGYADIARMGAGRNDIANMRVGGTDWRELHELKGAGGKA